jgi:para-aminobenzoate synthetase / 4-amino-4-deoxychorismate lyase
MSLPPPIDEAFLLCEDSRAGPFGQSSLLFQKPIDVLRAHQVADVVPMLHRARAALARGHWIAGWLGFEAGYALEPHLAPLCRQPPDQPLLWLGVFPPPQRIDAGQTDRAWRTAPATPNLAPPLRLTPNLTEAAHGAAVDQIIAAIRAGEVYQVNLTFPANADYSGNPIALYKALREAQRVAHGALHYDGDQQWILSFSPELFFDLHQGVLITRPMKGTAARKSQVADDRASKDWLQHDPKNRAENLMIVDLMRNDLSRVSAPGSVRVEHLFEVESYATVHQMTSTITSQIASDKDAIDVLLKLFPCGSVTGAPKIAAMKMIAKLETEPRGVYTGAIGWIAPHGDAQFNVAIRTLTVKKNQARLGLGGGIVLDSLAEDEWHECHMKAKFVEAPPPPFDLIETFAWTGGCRNLTAHLDRLAASADRFQFAACEGDWRQFILDYCDRLPQGAWRVRCLCSRSGALSLQAQPLKPLPTPLSLILCPLPISADSPFLAHKTTHRRFYDDTRLQLNPRGEVIFYRPDGQITEGSFTTVFIERDGVLHTPPLYDAVLPGVLRAELIRSGRAHEQAMTCDDLRTAERIWVGNSVRGLMPAVWQSNGQVDEKAFVVGAQ